jgi:DNA-directed RNA polymerase specialized sigma subunit
MQRDQIPAESGIGGRESAVQRVRKQRGNVVTSTQGTHQTSSAQVVTVLTSSQILAKEVASDTAPPPSPPNTPTEPQTQDVPQEIPAVPADDRKRWENLPEKQLWGYFAKLRQLYFAARDKGGAVKGTPLADRYWAVKRKLFEIYESDTARIAENYQYRHMPQYSLLERDDLRQAVVMAMYKLLDEYDPGYGTITFMQFANARDRSRLRGAILDCLRTLQEFPRSIAKNRRLVKPMMANLRNVLRHKPTLEEFCDYYGWHWKAVLTDRLFATGVFNQGRVVVDATDESIEVDSIQQVESRHQDNDAVMSRVDNIDRILECLPDDDMRYIVWAYYFVGDTNDRIRDSLRASGRKCSLSLVVSKHKAAIAILREKFTLESIRTMASRADYKGPRSSKSL